MERCWNERWPKRGTRSKEGAQGIELNEKIPQKNDGQRVERRSYDGKIPSRNVDTELCHQSKGFEVSSSSCETEMRTENLIHLNFDTIHPQG